MNKQGAKIGKTYPKTMGLSVDSSPRVVTSNQKKIEWTPRATDTARKDIADWRKAQREAEDAEYPNNARLQNIYKLIMQDNRLTSQIENRISKAFNVDFTLETKDGTTDEEATIAFRNTVPWRDLMRAISESIYYEYSMVEFNWEKDVNNNAILTVNHLPRTNILPQKGIFYYDLADPSKFLPYREANEYGIWWLEFGNATHRALLNKAVPHVLMKSFAQSCWAELCEIYGIPPRFIKTNTQDPAMIGRAEKMMRDMGAAAWFIIDNTEEFNFANGVQTNGDVYNNLIHLCNDENSMLISGAIIGQDTVNGSRSKDEASQEVLWELVMQDLVLIEDNFNKIVLPALAKIGAIKEGYTFRFDIPEDLDTLWTRVKDAINNYDFDTEWLNEKFGLKITGVKQPSLLAPNLNHSDGFFV